MERLATREAQSVGSFAPWIRLTGTSSPTVRGHPRETSEADWLRMPYLLVRRVAICGRFWIDGLAHVRLMLDVDELSLKPNRSLL